MATLLIYETSSYYIDIEIMKTNPPLCKLYALTKKLCKYLLQCDV